MTREETLRDRILAYLIEYHSLTSMEAVSIFHTTRLGARIKELREEGHKIATVMTDETDPITGERYRYGKYIYHGFENVE
jgi:hypothetical protein